LGFLRYSYEKATFSAAFYAAMDVCTGRFDGTWKMKMDTLQFSGPPEDYLFADGMYHCKSCIPKVDVKTDGVDYEVTGHAYDTLAVGYWMTMRSSSR
jgi:hypothetical protein